MNKKKSLLHERLGKRGENPTRFEKEKLDFFLKVRQTYLKMAKEDHRHWIIINADQSPETISEEIYSGFKKYLKGKHGNRNN